MLFKKFFFLALFCFSLSYGDEVEDLEFCLIKDLALVEKINQEITFELPLLFNYTSQSGYFAMPSARMPKEGMGGFVFASVPPYQIYSLYFQLFNRLAISGNYWIFKGFEDSLLSPHGFGDYADRAGNISLALLQKTDGFDFLPEIAVGANDFFGSKRFTSYYIVGTKQFLDYCIEATFGWGSGRISGFFGALAWSPFARCNPILKNFTLAAEYDANHYNRPQEHPEGKTSKYPINFGVHYTLLDLFQVNVSSIRGEDIAASASIYYNIGQSEGLFKKTGDPLPYTTPIDSEPLGLIRKDKLFAQELCYAFTQQGLDLYTVRVKENKILWLKVVNQRYRKEKELRNRIEQILGALTPCNIERVVVVIESMGVCTQQYNYSSEDLRRFHSGRISSYEFDLVYPMEEVTCPPGIYDSALLFQRKKRIWSFLTRPRFNSFFGSAKGKFKYDLSLISELDGYLFDQVYYQLLASYSVSSSMKDLADCDRLNPSQLINVHTDMIVYHRSNTFHIEQAYLQRSWNMGSGFFTRLGLGYFESAYGGIALESLYYPVFANWAIGFEVDLLKKRNYSGMGFTDKIRKLNGFCPEEVPFPYALQYFLEFYYDYYPLKADVRISVGQFLARDKGIKIETGKDFCNGFRLYFWYTLTNGEDVVNGSRYYDKGFGFSIPLDFFTHKSSKDYVGYSMSAWLRDVGARAWTGKRLHSIIYQERFPFE